MSVALFVVVRATCWFCVRLSLCFVRLWHSWGDDDCAFTFPFQTGLRRVGRVCRSSTDGALLQPAWAAAHAAALAATCGVDHARFVGGLDRAWAAGGTDCDDVAAAPAAAPAVVHRRFLYALAATVAGAAAHGSGLCNGSRADPSS